MAIPSTSTTIIDDVADRKPSWRSWCQDSSRLSTEENIVNVTASSCLNISRHHRPFSLFNNVILLLIVICCSTASSVASDLQSSTDITGGGRIVNRNLVLSNGLPVGRPVVQFGNHTGTIEIDDRSEFAQYFEIDSKSGSNLIVARSLDVLTNRGGFLLDLILKTPLSNGNTLERVESFVITIVPETSRNSFANDLYVGRLRLDAPARTLVPGLERIALKSGTTKAEGVRFSLLDFDDDAIDEEFENPIDEFIELVTVRDPYESTPYVQAWTKRRPEPADRGTKVFAVQVDGYPTGNRDQVRVELRIDDDMSYPPVFVQRRYLASIIYDDVPLGSTILRVRALSGGGIRDADDIVGSTITYSIEPSDGGVPFDVDPFTGDVFATSRPTANRYSFDIVAREGSISSRTPVKIIATRHSDQIRKLDDDCGDGTTINATDDTVDGKRVGGGGCDETTIRYKRALRPEISMRLPENYATHVPLPERIRLGSNERIKDAPVEKDHLTVLENGTIQLIQALNYEREKVVQLMVMVENIITLEDSPQRIVINVEDVDEKPRFINEPVPYLAVVKPQTYVGFVVFTFQAVDELGDLLEDQDGVGYQQINAGDGDGGHFKVDALGRVKTLQKTYPRGEEFQVYVQAFDKKPKDPNAARSDIAVLTISVGERAPQFYQERYKISVSENTPIGASVAVVKAKSFDDYNPVKYDLFENTAANMASRNRTRSDTFTIDEKIGVIHLRKELDYDSGQQPRSFSLKAVASTGILTSEVPIEIHVADVNDHDPAFSQPLYTATVKEDIRIGQKILQVSAKDRDSGRNAAIRYYVDNNNFTVNEDGVISARVRLNADQKQQGHFIYRFTVTARDRGDPPRSTTSQVQIKTENVNDEAPIFIPTSQYTEYVAEDAQGNTPIVTIQAQDPDRDQVKYYFFSSGARTLTLQHFEIDSDTGVIKLRDGVTTDQLKKQDLYHLSVIAVDDGACCKDQNGIRHTSTATVMIGVKDVNNNKPSFKECASYTGKARVPEGKHKNYTVLKVEAIDNDSGQNGDIVYSLYYPQGESRRPFIIDPNTGVIMASPYEEFDREERPFEEITVKATDRGERPLIGFCHFTVTVLDDNDNAPSFDRATYEKTISRSMQIGHSVVTVFADDRDAPDNARVAYSLAPDLSEPEHVRDTDYFQIRPDGGEVMLTQPIPPDRTKMTFLVEATDNGKPPKKSSVKVTIEVAEAAMHYPVWQNTPNCIANITRGEDTPVNSIFAECYALSGTNPDNPISYSMRNGAKVETNSNGDFREFLVKHKGKDWVTIRNLKVLDYEKIKRYDLTLTATDMRNNLSKDKTFVIYLLDRNDNVPKFATDVFTGQIDEELKPDVFSKKQIVTISARDADHESSFKDITYSILPGLASSLFRIEPKSGTIYAVRSFDREQNDSFILDVQAEDGALSSLPGVIGPNAAITKVQVFVGDVNDNHPFFNQSLYEGQVRENAASGQNVLTVKAHDLDKDSQLRYSLAPDGNGQNKFAVSATSGAISVYKDLDFEKDQEYNLILYVTDGHNDHRAETRIRISVTDVNDNAPVFKEQIYVKALVEEDKNVPRPIMTVTATDKDKAETNGQIVYRLVGQGANKEFTINEETGQIFVNEPLDRDPPNGSEQWNFVVHAIDDNGHGLIGYADVQVNLTDINDNAPYFEGGPHTGYIEEGQKMTDRPLGVYVMTMTATDNDDPKTSNAKLTYQIVRNKYLNNTPVFRIEPHTGKLYAMVELDRENPAQKQFEIEVKATDQGDKPRSGVGKAIIKVTDINDCAPYFDNIRPFESMVKETALVHSPVMSLSAKDPDDEAFDNVLQYSLVESAYGDLGTRYFYITTDPDISGSNVGTIRVKQPLDYEDTSQRPGFNLTVRVTDGRYFASAPVRLTLLDQNDNKPLIAPAPNQFLREDTPVGTNIIKFTATDPDLRDQERVEFRINRTTDPDRQFFIGPKDGVLKVAKPLDREKIPQYRLVIEAVDEANNVGHTILVVNLEDVNDNAPELNISKIPIIYENVAPVVSVAMVTAFDRDTPENGPPFFMSIPSNSTYADKFNFVFVQGADYSRGAMNISTKVAFNREKDGKRLELPILVRDNGKPPMESIRYFPVIIGDENDNPMSDGKSVIQVYNYNNKMPITSIGRAYVQDEDDWDVSDKSFNWKGKQPDGFTLSPDGIITVDPAYATLPEYNLEISVTDNKRGENAIASVRVLIEIISETAFKNAGSIRIKNIEAEDFIRNFDDGGSMYDTFRQFLADKLGVPKTNVAVFSVMSEGTHPPVIQVYFAARGSPYKPATYLNGVVAQNKYELEQLLGRGVQITQVNVDDCVFESCEYGCERLATADSRPTVWNANQTGLVGVSTSVIADCGHCAVPPVPRSCSPNPCLNGGLCHETDPGVFCECRGDFHGPFCEGRMRTFSGNSYAWLDPIKPCTDFHLRFEFMTTSDNALLLYDGPMAAARIGDYGNTDFIAVEILNGKPALLLNLGHGGIYVRMNNAPNVNDGNWHRLDIILKAQDFTMTLDGCSYTQMAILNGNNNQTDCQVVGNVPNDYEQLNIVDPLQIGGLATGGSLAYPPLNVTNGVDGCLRNLYINEVLQDLGSPPNAVQSGVGCTKTDSICMKPLEPQCVNGYCVSSVNDKSARCICDPGFVGDRCDQKIHWRNYEQGSYVSYNFLDSMPMSPTSMAVRMVVVPRKSDGVLFRGTSVTGYGNVQMEIAGYLLKYTSGVMGSNQGFGALAEDSVVTLKDTAKMNATKPYMVEIRRELSYIKVSLDGMPDPLTATSYEKSPPLDLDRKRLYAGADTENPQQAADFQGCVAQIYYDESLIPVSQSDNPTGSQSNAVVTGQKSVSDGCPELQTCASLGLSCPVNYICVDFWKGPFCTCPPDLKPVFNPDGVWENCGETTAQPYLGITNGAVASILICLLVLLILVLLLVVYSRRRRVLREPSPYSDVRENIINYAEEGGGEEDQDRYNIAPLRKPVLPTDDFRQQHAPPISNGRPTTPPDANMEDLIRDRLRLADTDPTAPPYDELRAYADEDAMSVGSLSSLSSDEEDDVEWDALNNWGPRFRKLAELYGSQD